MPRKPGFKWVEFLRDYEVVKMHFRGERHLMRDWLAESLVSDGTARFCEAPEKELPKGAVA
jgi:hypothetical protein